MRLRVEAIVGLKRICEKSEYALFNIKESLRQKWIKMSRL